MKKFFKFFLPKNLYFILLFYYFILFYFYFILFYFLDYVKIKLLHTSNINFAKNSKKTSLFGCCSDQKNYTKNSLIFHVHGGGFVAMSSSSHENYLRK